MYVPVLVADYQQLKNTYVSGLTAIRFWTDSETHSVGCGSQGPSAYEQSLQDAFEFLGVSCNNSCQFDPIVLETVHASLEGLAVMCRLHFSISLQTRTFNAGEQLGHTCSKKGCHL